MVRAAHIVSWEQRIELRNPFVVGRLQTTEERRVDVRDVEDVAVSLRHDPGVHAGAVAVPDLEHGVGDGVAGRHVDYLGVEDEVDAYLGLGDVFADVFSGDVWGINVSGACMGGGNTNSRGPVLLLG